MRTIIILGLILIAGFAQAQTDNTINKGSGILYFSGRPVFNPSVFSDYSEIAFDLNGKKFYVYSGAGDVWGEYDAGVDNIDTLIYRNDSLLVRLASGEEFKALINPFTSLTQAELVDTATVTFKPVGQLVWFEDVEQHWYWDGAAWGLFSGGGGTAGRPAAEVPYTNNSQSNVEGALDSLFNKPSVTGLADTLANLQSHTPILRDTKTYTTNFTAKMEVNLVDISAGSLTVTAPAAPSIGDCFSVRLVNSSLGGNTCTVEMNTDKYLGETTLPAASHIINTVGGSATFQYVNITTGWTLKSSN